MERPRALTTRESGPLRRTPPFRRLTGHPTGPASGAWACAGAGQKKPRLKSTGVCHRTSCGPVRWSKRQSAHLLRSYTIRGCHEPVFVIVRSGSFARSSGGSNYKCCETCHVDPRQPLESGRSAGGRRLRWSPKGRRRIRLSHSDRAERTAQNFIESPIVQARSGVSLFAGQDSAESICMASRSR